MKELLHAKSEEIDGKTSTTALDPALTDALREWAHAADDKTLKRKELLDRLEEFRESVELDLLIIVTQGGDALSAPLDPAGAAWAAVFRDDARRAAEKSLREARASSGTATFMTGRPGTIRSAAGSISRAASLPGGQASRV